MRAFLVGLLVLSFLSAPVVAAAAEGGEATVVFVGVTVVDVERGELIAGRAVVTVGPKITEVVAAEGHQPPPAATVVDGAGKYLIPGLWDMHVHHPFPWDGFLDLALANGVTGVRDLNGETFLYAWRDEIQGGKRVGPRIVTSGKYLDARMNGQPPDRVTADTPEQGRQLVRERKQQGADLIKVYSGLRPDVYRAIMEEAKAQGLPVAGHCPELVGALEASRLGQRSIEHLTGVALASSRDERELLTDVTKVFNGPHGYDLEDANRPLGLAMESIDPKKQAALFDAFKANRTWQTPTLVVQRPLPAANAPPDPRMQYLHPAVTQLWTMVQRNDPHAKVRLARTTFAQKTVRAMNDAGVPLLAGTDAGGAFGLFVYPGFSLADELELLVTECGLTPAQALRTATLNPALYFGEALTAGTVAAGKRADLVLLSADPLTSIGNIRKIDSVLANGKWLPKAELDRRLQALADANAKMATPTR